MMTRRVTSRKGDSSSPTIMWIGVILAILIIVAWFLLHLRPAQQEMKGVQYDLESIRASMQKGCGSIQYIKVYNPRTEKGQLTFNESQVCINSTTFSQCTTALCPMTGAGVIDLANISTIIINASGGKLALRIGG